MIDWDDLDGIEIWERLPGETSKAFEAFVAYRNLPAVQRSIIQTYRVYSGKPRAKNAPSRFYQWAKDNRWQERVEAWERYLDRINLEQEEMTRLEWRNNRRAVLQAALVKTAGFVDELKPGETAISITQLTGLIRMVIQELRTEFMDDIRSHDDPANLPPIIFQNISVAQYEQRAEERAKELEVIDAKYRHMIEDLTIEADNSHNQ